MIARRLAREIPNIDQHLPFWAQRKNPIVRRQLGMYWRVFPPRPMPIIKWVVLQSVILLLSIVYQWLFIFILTLLLAAAVILPYTLYVYVGALGHIIAEATTAMTDEYKNDTITLLRTTPYTTTEIILSKIAASVWRRMDDLDQVMSFALWLSAPSIAIIYISGWPPTEYTGIAQGMTVVTFVASLIRLPLEMFMVACMGVMVGAAVHIRSTAFLGTVGMAFFYFLLINLLRLIDWNWPMQLVVDAVLPVVLPVVISYIAIRLTLYFIKRD